LDDPNFHRTVVLVLQHGAEGAFGLVVNRPVTTDDLPFPVYVGGPCKMDGMLLLHGQEDWLDGGQSGKVCDGVYLGDAACAERVTEAGTDAEVRFRMFSGYSGWGPQQLESEIAQRAWAVVPASSPLMFDTPVEELWTRVLPPNIPEPSLN